MGSSRISSDLLGGHRCALCCSSRLRQGLRYRPSSTLLPAMSQSAACILDRICFINTGFVTPISFTHAFQIAPKQRPNNAQSENGTMADSVSTSMEVPPTSCTRLRVAVQVISRSTTCRWIGSAGRSNAGVRLTLEIKVSSDIIYSICFAGRLRVDLFTKHEHRGRPENQDYRGFKQCGC